MNLQSLKAQAEFYQNLKASLLISILIPTLVVLVGLKAPSNLDGTSLTFAY
jgi:hypothetical protein